ncbi:hypothetical protein D3C77_481710 [compost metagenome]
MVGAALGPGTTGLGVDDGVHRGPAIVRHGLAERPGAAVRHPGWYGYVGAVHWLVRPDALVVFIGPGAVAGPVYRVLDAIAQRLGLFVCIGRLHRGDHCFAGDQPSAGSVRPGGGALHRDLSGDCLCHSDQRAALAPARRTTAQRSGAPGLGQWLAGGQRDTDRRSPGTQRLTGDSRAYCRG